MKELIALISLALSPVVMAAPPVPNPVYGNPFTTNANGSPILSKSPTTFTNAPLTVTSSNPSDTNQFDIPSFFARGLSIAKGELDLRQLEAVEGGADCLAILQQAAIICTNLDFTLVLNGTYGISAPWTIPSRLRMRGGPVDYTYKRNPQQPQGARLVTLGNFNAIQTARLTPPNDTINFWAADINIENIYIQGTQLQESNLTASVGLDISGCRNSRFANIHIEGFGTAALFENVAEVDTFNFVTQNNYYGGINRRDPPDGGRVYDCIIDHWNYMNVNNVVPWVFDNVRVAKLFGGEFINNLTNAVPKISIINTGDDSQIALIGVKAGENQGREALIVADTNGFDNFSAYWCNFAVNNFNQPVMRTEGFFNQVSIEENTFQRTTLTNMVAPIFWAQRPPTDQNNYVRKNGISVQRNTPHWFDIFVRNDQLMASIENDYLPDDYIPLNPVLGGATGIAGNDGVISIAGNHAFTTNSINQNGKVYWQDAVVTNNVYTLLTPSRLTKGITHIYATAVGYDNDGADIPILNVQGWGAQGEWNRISQAKIGSYTNPTTGIVFSKWAWCVTVQDQSKATNGLEQVQLFHIYATDVADPNRSDYGLETFRVYASKKENPYGPVFQEIAGFPTTGLEGYAFKNQIKWNNYSTNQNIVGFVPRSFTQTLDINTIGNVYSPDSQGQYELPYMAGATGGGLGASGLFGAAGGGKLAIGTASTAAASRLIMTDTTTGLMAHLSNTNSLSFMRFSDLDNFSFDIGVNATSDYGWIGINNNHLRFLLDGSLYTLGTLTADTSVVTPLINLNGVPRTTWPTGTTLPADAPGWLENDGAGNLSWTTPPGGGGTWGSITGTLGDQTDLATALDGKQPLDVVTATKAFRSYQGSLTHAGTVTLDFDGTTTVNALSITGNVTFATSNLATNRTYRLKITGTTTNSTPTFPAWVFMTGSPLLITSNKVSMLTLEAWGAADANVVAWFQEQP